MRKLIIAYILAAAILFAGCAKETSHTETKKNAAGTEPNITEATNKMDKEFEDKVKAIDDIGQEVIENIRTEASKAISEIRELIPTTTKTITTTTKVMPASKTIELNVASESAQGKVIIKSVYVDYHYGTLWFKYNVDLTQKLNLDMDSFKCTTKSGKVLSWGARSIPSLAEKDGRWISVGEGSNMEFYGFDSPEDASTVTLTYAFEGYEPVTVTFDIPGL